MGKKYVVTLTEEERGGLQKLVSMGKSAARRLNHARILLLADASPRGLRRSDEEIVEALHCGVRTVERVRERFVEEGFDAARGRTCLLGASGGFPPAASAGSPAPCSCWGGEGLGHDTSGRLPRVTARRLSLRGRRSSGGAVPVARRTCPCRSCSPRCR
jgi:hypothetical protein